MIIKFHATAEHVYSMSTPFFPDIPHFYTFTLQRILLKLFVTYLSALYIAWACKSFTLPRKKMDSYYFAHKLNNHLAQSNVYNKLSAQLVSKFTIIILA